MFNHMKVIINGGRRNCLCPTVTTKRMETKPTIQPTRSFAKVLVRKPTQPSFDKKVLMAIAEPIERIDRREPWEKCRKGEFVKSQKERSQDIHPWAVIKGRKFQERMLSSNIVLVCHENCVDEEDGRIERNKITKNGFSVERHNRMIQRLAFQDTKYDFLLGGEGIRGHGTIAHTTYILGPDSSKLKQVLDIIKKMPTFLLMFGIIDKNHVLRRDELMKVSTLPSLDSCRSQLVSTINHYMAMVPLNVTNQIHTLHHNLDTYINDIKKKTKDEK